MCDCNRFQTFYGNNKSKTCHGSDKLGDQYVCPTPTIGGNGVPLGSGAQLNKGCGIPAPNMGRLAYCGAQTGGGPAPVLDMMYGATGNLVPKRRSGCGCQSGGSAEAEGEAEAPPNPNPEPEEERLGQEPVPLDRGRCPCASTPIDGYFLNLSQPSVGNRPVRGKYNNYNKNNILDDRVNLPKRRFDCCTPMWGENCM